MTDRNLATMFLNAPATTTEKGANSRIEKVLHILIANDIPYTIVKRLDEKFIAVAFISDRTSQWMQLLISKNVCVTSA